jgi:hypothetical protein
MPHGLTGFGVADLVVIALFSKGGLSTVCTKDPFEMAKLIFAN